VTIALVIFDCDGVLVDSEPLAMRVLLRAMHEQGADVTPSDAYRNYLGRSLASISESLRGSHGMPLRQPALAAMRHDLYDLFRAELRPAPGLPGILERLGAAWCVASSSQPERIRLSLEVTGLLPWFEPNIFSASMVENGKPAPDLFLLAARSMRVEPARCLVVEDSPAGIAAARRAGMRVLAYAGGSHVGPAGLLPEIARLAPDGIFDDMHALPDLVRSLRTEKKAD